MENLIVSERNGRVLELVLNRPTKKNALSMAMYRQLTTQLEAAEQDKQIHVVLLRGEGDSFCAGNDIADFVQSAADGEALRIIIRFLHTLAGFSKPIVAAVQGDAVGIGTTMLLHCDLVIAADNLRCQMPFVKLGLVPEAGSTLLLPQMLGQRVAFELLVEGVPFGADKACSSGIVNQVTDVDSFLFSARERAEKIAKLPFESVIASKKLMKKSYLDGLQQTIDTEGELFQQRLFSEDAQRALMAFLQK